jgi:hypothetical protein
MTTLCQECLRRFANSFDRIRIQLLPANFHVVARRDSVRIRQSARCFLCIYGRILRRCADPAAHWFGSRRIPDVRHTRFRSAGHRFSDLIPSRFESWQARRLRRAFSICDARFARRYLAFFSRGIPSLSQEFAPQFRVRLCRCRHRAQILSLNLEQVLKLARGSGCWECYCMPAQDCYTSRRTGLLSFGVWRLWNHRNT